MRASTSIRLDSDTKEIASEVFRQYGMSLSDGINLFCRQVAMTHSIPFELKVPSARMQEALNELKAKKGKKFESIDELKKDLLS